MVLQNNHPAIPLTDILFQNNLAVIGKINSQLILCLTAIAARNLSLIHIFASAFNFDNVAQGGAYLHNLCCGIMRRVGALDRDVYKRQGHIGPKFGQALRSLKTE